MTTKSKIEWTEQTWNPVVGCTKISAGCKNCYAETMSKRLTAMGTRGYESGWLNRINYIESELNKPLERKKPTVYFVCSMTDLFQEGMDFDYVDRVFEVIAKCPQHTFQILTKRAEIMETYFNVFRDGNVPTNAWIGVTVENNQAKHRIKFLNEIDAKIKFLSCEPLLEDLGNLNLSKINWVIAGGESGHNARPIHPNWARSIRDQCAEAGAQFFFKQWGEWGEARNYGAYKNFMFPDGQLMHKCGKKLAGHLLDGVAYHYQPPLIGGFFKTQP